MLAFALAGTQGCVPMWGAQVPINDPSVINPIKAVQAAGGQFVVSTGGAAGSYLENSCSTSETLAAAYMTALDAVGTNNLDLDIESSINADMVNKAVAMVQSQRPNTTISYTLEVQAENYGLTPVLGVQVLQSAVANGVRVDSVNPMTMDFPTSSSDYGTAVINAAQAVFGQMQTIWPQKSSAELYKMLSVTPMIGRNDNGMVYTQAHANALVNWANQNHIGRLHFWSAGRDNGKCAGSATSPSCSSIPQSDYEFTKIFQGFTG